MSSAIPSPSGEVQVRVDGACGSVIWKRTARANALTPELVASIQQALEDLHGQKSVRAVVMTGAGEFFSAGTDLLDLQASRSERDAHQRWLEELHQFRELLAGMLRYPKPLVAALNGPALGSGLALAAACDVVLAAPQAHIGCPEIRWGLNPGMAVPLLAFRVGAARTAQLTLRGQTVTAEEAHRWGLIHEIVPFELLWARARELSLELAAPSPTAWALSKRVLNETVGENLFVQLSAAAAATAATRTMEHAEEGGRAFVEKRPPVWP